MKTILIVEDEQFTLSNVVYMLTLEGFNAIGAENGRVGMQFAREHQPDLIICDIMMPEMNGYEVLHEVRNDPLLAATPFIFLTARNENRDMRLGMNLGADDYLTKPFEVNELLKSIGAVLKKQALVREAILNEIKSHIFLSYSRKDAKIMRQIHESLSQEFKIWCDEKLELGTADWEQAVVRAIKHTDSLVVILSPDAEQSKWVGRELAMAEILGVRIFPVLARGDERTAIPLRLISHQWLDVRHDYDTSVEKLIAVLRKHLKIS